MLNKSTHAHVAVIVPEHIMLIATAACARFSHAQLRTVNNCNVSINKYNHISKQINKLFHIQISNNEGQLTSLCFESLHIEKFETGEDNDHNC